MLSDLEPHILHYRQDKNCYYPGAKSSNHKMEAFKPCLLLVSRKLVGNYFYESVQELRRLSTPCYLGSESWLEFRKKVGMSNDTNCPIQSEKLHAFQSVTMRIKAVSQYSFRPLGISVISIASMWSLPCGR